MPYSVLLEMERILWDALLHHLLPPHPRAEEAAFVFACPTGGAAGQTVLRVVDHAFVAPDGFALRSLHAIELSDETRARVIKRAHDLSASLVEFHSHPFPYPAEFSPTDRAGLAEVVPHVRWRLKGRPYVAVVVAPDTFDSLVWSEADSTRPDGVAAIRLGTELLAPTGLSEGRWTTRHA
jgi:proteasome lid subunit RPN8/RPN11